MSCSGVCKKSSANRERIRIRDQQAKRERMAKSQKATSPRVLSGDTLESRQRRSDGSKHSRGIGAGEEKIEIRIDP
jgi:endonuclease YncB( thermonuclease family)